MLRVKIGAGWAVALLLVAGCKKDSTSPELSIADVVLGITAQGSSVTLVQGSAPASSAGGPQVTVVAPPSVINGGTTQVDLASPEGFSEVVVFIPDRPDYYRVQVANAVNALRLNVTLSPDLPSTFSLSYKVGSNGSFGAAQSKPMSVIPVGTGEVQISVTWDSQADLDLHVLEPSGEEIWYGNDESATGGKLDLDSNAGCFMDGARSENITWRTGTAPRGQYTVRLDHWANCGASSTNWVVTVRIAGRTPTVFTGTFTGSGTQGGPGAGQQVTTFQY